MVNYFGIFQRTHENWYSLAIDYSFGKYLRHLFWLSTYKTKKLGRPSRDEHITLIDKYETNKYSREALIPLIGRKYNFSLSLQIKTNENALWLPVYSNELEKIRSDIGLGQKLIPLHYCIGYKYEGRISDSNKEIRR